MLKQSFIFILFIVLICERVKYAAPKTADVIHDPCPNQCKPTFTLYTNPTLFLISRTNDKLPFNCEATGKPSPNITWFKNDVNLNETRPYWIINRTTLQDAGNYTCNVCNALGCINRVFNISVYRPKLKIIEGPENITVNRGESATFSCEYSPTNDPEFTMEWYGPTENPVDPERGPTKSQISARIEGEKSSFLRISKPTVQQNGWYSCAGHNEQSRFFSSGYLKVQVSADAIFAKLLKRFEKKNF